MFPSPTQPMIMFLSIVRQKKDYFDGDENCKHEEDSRQRQEIPLSQ